MDRVYQVMAWAFAFVFGMVILLSFYGEARAATVSVYNYENSEAKYIWFSGPVEEGDALRLETAYNTVRNNQRVVPLILNSPGGSGKEMMKIVDYMKGREFHARLTQDRTCYSACAVIWTMAKYRTIDSDFTGTIGYHISSMSVGQQMQDYQRDHGIFGFQTLVQSNFALDMEYYAEMPVENKLDFIMSIMKHGWAAHVFWEPTRAELDRVVGLTYYPNEGLKNADTSSYKLQFNSSDIQNIWVRINEFSNKYVEVQVIGHSGAKLQFTKYPGGTYWQKDQVIQVNHNGLLDLKVGNHSYVSHIIVKYGDETIVIRK